MQEDDGDIYRPVQMSLRVLYMVLLGGQLMFAAIVFVISGSGHQLGLRQSDAYTIAITLFTTVMIPGGYLIFGQRMKLARATDDPAEKMDIYRQAFILRCATNEGVSLFAIILVLLSHSYAYYGFLAISLFFFAMAYPSLDKMKQQIGAE